MKCKKFVLKQMYDGFPKISDFELTEEEVSEKLEDGEFLYESVHVSVDPYIRAYAGSKYNVGDTVISTTLVKITESKSNLHKKGALVVLRCGWRNGGKAKDCEVWTERSDMPSNVPSSSALGLYGVPGIAAYIAMILVCDVKKGETVFISGSAGAVGSVGVQIAKSKGCRVVGSCGTDQKVEYCKKIGYDDAFNYKTEASDLSAAIKRVAPDGIDCYLDNVGWLFSNAVFQHINHYGRVALCGSISTYHEKGTVQAPVLLPLILFKELTVKGFALWGYHKQYKEIYSDLKKWTEEGKLKNYETITKGFEKIPEAFVGMLRGANIGKAVVSL